MFQFVWCLRIAKKDATAACYTYLDFPVNPTIWYRIKERFGDAKPTDTLGYKWETAECTITLEIIDVDSPQFRVVYRE